MATLLNGTATTKDEDSAAALVIEQIGAGQADTEDPVQASYTKTVRLTARALPYRGSLEFGTKQRVELTWYPGYAEATATVLGASEDTSSWNGMWKDKFIGEVTQDGKGALLAPIQSNNEPVINAEDAVALFEYICRAGQQLRVTWGRQVRVGFLTDFRAKWHNRHDVEWTMEFAWVSRGEPVAPAIVTTANTITQTTTTYQQLNDAIQNDAAFLFATSTEFQSALFDELVAVNGAVNALVFVAANLNNQTTSPGNASNNAVAAANNTVLACDSMSAALTKNVVYSCNDTVPLADLTYGQRVAAAAYINQLLIDVRTLRNFALQQQDSLLNAADNQIQGIYTARNGDDLRKVSRQYYGTPFEWQRLQNFNALTSLELYAGQVVYIPKIQTNGNGT